MLDSAPRGAVRRSSESEGRLGGKQVVIIGGGVSGLASAYYALERGHAVTLLESGPPDHDCCSLGNAGFISPSHFIPLAAPGVIGKAIRWMGDPESPFYVRMRPDPAFLAWAIRFWLAATPRRARRAGPLLRDLNLASRSLFEDLASATGNEFELTREGLLLLFRSRGARRGSAPRHPCRAARNARHGAGPGWSRRARARPHARRRRRRALSARRARDAASVLRVARPPDPRAGRHLRLERGSDRMGVFPPPRARRAHAGREAWRGRVRGGRRLLVGFA